MAGLVARQRAIRVAHVAMIDATFRWLLLPQLRRLAEEGYAVAAISAPGPWTEEIEAAGIRHIPWPHATRSWAPGADLLALRELVAILRKERFDLVHTHTPKGGLIGRLGGRLAAVPHVVNTVHGLYATREDAWRRKLPVLACEWLAARFSDFELYQSQEDLRWARRLGVVGAGKSALLGNGADLAHFDPGRVDPARVAALRQQFGIQDGTLVVGTVARLVREKGYRELAVAARHVAATVQDVRFLAVGPGDLLERDAITERDVDEAGLVFTGMRTDVRDLLAVMDVFVLATWREGMPRSAIEAAAMGKAMVLTDIRGCREVVRQGIEGILVPPRDPEALTGALLHLLGDGELRVRLGGAARRRALELFDERSVEDKVLATYRRLLRDAAPAGLGRQGGTSPADEVAGSG